MPDIKVVFGGGAFPHGPYADPKVQAEALDILLKSGVTTIDSARLYPGSEEAIGQLEKRTSFAIDTKLQGGFAAETGSGKEQVTLDHPHPIVSETDSRAR